MFAWLSLGAAPGPADLPAADGDWFADGTVPLEWDLARASAALGRGPDGRWASHAADVPRFHHDPATLAPLGLLVEAADATQLVFRSRAPDGTVGAAPLAATLSTDTSEQTPFGLGATRVLPASSSSLQHGVVLTFGAGGNAAEIPDGATASIRAVAKPFGTSYPNVEFLLRDRAGSVSSVGVSLAGGGAVVSGSGNAVAAVRPDTDGFLEITLTAPFGTGAVAPTCTVLVVPATGARDYVPDGVSGTLLAYLGAELGTAATSPIATDGATATRRADALSCATDWLLPGPASFALRYAPLSDAPATVLHASGPDLLELRHAAGSLAFAVAVGGASSAQLTAPAPPAGTARTVVAVAAPDEFRVARDGAVAGTDTAGPMPAALPAMRIGAGPTGAQAGSFLISRMKYWSRALSAAEAEAFSADPSIPGTAPAVPTVEVQPARTVMPSEPAATLVLLLSGEPAGASVRWRTVDGTAVAGTDYVASRGTATFAPGSHSAGISVSLGPRPVGADRTFSVQLLGPDGAALGNRTCAVTIRHVVSQGAAPAVQSEFGAGLPAGWALERATPARARDAAGDWAEVAAGQPRDHHLAPGSSGLLIEAAGTEQRLYDSVDPGWTAVGSTKSLDAATQTMLGSRTLAWRKSDATEDHRLSLVLSPANCDMPAGEFTVSAVVRPVGVRYWLLRTKGIDNVWRQATLDLDGAGAVVAADSGALAWVAADPFHAGWYAVALDRSQAASAGVSAEVQLVPAVDAFGNVSQQGDATQGLDLIHLQLEPAAGYSAPVPVQGASAKTVVAPDVLRASGTWHQRPSYTLGMRFVRLRDAPAMQRVVQLKNAADPTTTDDIGLRMEGGIVVLRLRTGNTQHPGVGGGVTSAGFAHTLAMAVDHDARIALFELGSKMGEAALGSGGVAAALTPAVLRVGSTEPSGLEPAAILLQAVYQWNDPLPDAEAAPFSAALDYAAEADPPPLPVLSLPAAASVDEGATLALAVSKSGAGACSATVRTLAASGGASVGTDYVAVDQTVSFLEAETVKTVPIATLADAAADSGETVAVALLDPAGCELGNAACVVTVVEPTVVTIPATASVAEGAAVSVPLTKTGPGACSVTVQTGQVSAAVGVDYVGWNPTVMTFAAGETAKTITVQTIADAATEGNETFNINVFNPSGCTIANNRCVVTITPPA